MELMTGWLWMLEIEISDAFMSEWGFSWGDMLANTAGAAFFVFSNLIMMLLEEFNPKSAGTNPKHGKR